MDDKMTLYFFKSNGKIEGASSGTQDMSYYGENKADYSLIIDFVVLEMDKKVFFNFNDFRVNPATRVIEIRPEAVAQYPVAAQ